MTTFELLFYASWQKYKLVVCQKYALTRSAAPDSGRNRTEVKLNLQSATKLMSCVNRHFSFFHCSQSLLSISLGHLCLELG